MAAHRVDLATAARTAPRAPGVYCFFDASGDLLYVGKAVDLRRRLNDHNRASRNATVAAVAWEPCDGEVEALAREADLIVSLQPARNTAGRYFHGWCYLTTTPIPTGVRFELRKEAAAPAAGARTYGCFPHLGKGLTSYPGARCKRGYSALLRLLWHAGSDGRPVPSRLAGGSPPLLHDGPLSAAMRDPLHRFLAGTSPRLLALAGAHIEGLGLRLVGPPVIEREIGAATEFYALGPRRLRALRLRHGVPAGPLTPAIVADLIRAETDL